MSVSIPFVSVPLIERYQFFNLRPSHVYIPVASQSVFILVSDADVDALYAQVGKVSNVTE